jgi:SAM-dependent methyltransferase
MDAPATLFTDGKAYERLMGRWSQPVGAKFLAWLDPPKGLRWLDVGCGNGAFTEVLIARASPSAVTGIDPSDGQIDYARKRPGTKLAQFRVGDAQALPFADGSFDGATMALAITFVPDPLKAAREMTRVVKPGGWVATYMWDIPAGGIPTAPVNVAMNLLGIEPPNVFSAEASRRENMLAVWQRAGLRSLETEVIRIPVVYENFDEFWESNTQPVGPRGKLLEALSPGQREQLKARLRELVPVGNDGRIAYEAFANAVKGRVPA